ncbi:MAG TPA: GTP cyclohydrolase I FolE [Candidatus Sumerlaeota bacterium]|nr:MAG: GTP cyclohydrolase 1 [candidate division BRC1 bacterium ADurb.BinA292]HOE96594.1 GTP cyclohydrolase I FolE [Candidatus Sumerlaeota bacterium]HOR26554.1 GTP cyclohydrolase I FolE [Candidatus Sumerlaeota bacterium]HPK00883.1 GTP cyclohydrolase I FolE [Candidatus Sumerlaeota bacterium]
MPKKHPQPQPIERVGLDEDLADEQANPRIAEATRMLLTEIGEDPRRQGLARTPERVARAWEYLTQGYRTDLHTIVNGAIFDEKYDEMVAVKSIQFFSLCEHHLLPFYGKCHVAYIPDGKVVGISKIPRIVDMFARRLQIQERLTAQIAESLHEVLSPKGVGVVMEAYHMCMMMRGVEKQDSLTTTSEMLGVFKTSPQTRAEFLSLMGIKIA